MPVMVTWDLEAGQTMGKSGRGHRDVVPCWPGGRACDGCQEDLSEVMFKLRTEGGKGESCGDSSPDRGHGKCKGPGAELCLVCWRNSEGVCVAGAA